MNAAKLTLTATVLAAALGLALALTAAPAQAHCPHKGEIDGTHCAGDGGNVSNPDDFQAECDKLFNLPDGSCVKEGGGEACLFDVNVGVANGNPVMKISLVENCETDTMLVLPNFLVLGSPNPNFPLVAEFEGCNVVNPPPDCPSSDTNTFLDGRDFVLTAVDNPNPFSDNAVITNSTDHGDILDITIDIMASNAGCGGTPESAINIDLFGAPPVHAPPEHTWIRILGTTVRVTGENPLCNAIVMQNAPANVRTTTIVHDSIVEPLAYTDVGTLFSNLRFGSDTLGNIGVGSSTIGRPADGFSGTAVEFDNVDRGEITNNIIENVDDDGNEVPGTGVLVQDLVGEASEFEFTIKHNTIKGGDVGIQVGPFAQDTTINGLITKNMIVGDDGGLVGTFGILCDGAPNAITIRKNNTVIGYVTLIDPTCTP